MNPIGSQIKLIVIGVILLIILISGILLYRSGKKSGATKINISNPPLDDAGGAGISASEISNLSDEIYRDMKGVNGFGHNTDIWQKFLALSDTDVVKVYNEFNTDYQTESEQTLKEWVYNESAAFQPQWSIVKETVLQRFAKLNLV